MTTAGGTTVTIAQTITVLKHLAAGRQPDFAAQVTHLPQRVVEDIAEKYGWPDPDAVRKGIFDLTRTEQDTPAAPPSTPAPRPAAPVAQPRPDLSVATTARSGAHHAPPAEQRPRDAAASTAELLHMATESHKASTRNLGTKISGLLADLTQRLNDEETERLARIAAKREAQQKAKRIAELKAELAQLTGKTAKAKEASRGTSSTAGEPTAKQIREWAADKGIECPAVGRVPANVREAYDQAHATDAA